eukprot:8894-Chlamydomonas_euryale.AAC.3
MRRSHRGVVHSALARRRSQAAHTAQPTRTFGHAPLPAPQQAILVQKMRHVCWSISYVAIGGAAGCIQEGSSASSAHVCSRWPAQRHCQ